MNIFKKIKSIDETLDAFEQDNKSENLDDLAIPDLIDSANTAVDKPETSTKSDAAELSSKAADDLPVDIPKFLAAPAALQNLPDSSSKAANSLNLHPIDEPKAKLKVEQIIQSIVTVEPEVETEPQTLDPDINSEQKARETLASPNGSTDAKLGSLPAFITSEPAPALNAPVFKPAVWPYWGLALLAILWLVVSAAAAYGYFELGLDSLTAQPIHALGFAGFVFLPACLLLILALMLRRINDLSVESRKLAFLNEQLLTPSDFSAKSAAHLSEAITQQMDRIEQRADQAFHRLKTVQTAFSAQITDVANQLTTSAEKQTSFDSHLQSSKTAWATSVKDTDQSITDLSGTLDDVLSSFQTRIQTTQDQMSQIGDMLQRQSQDADVAMTPLFDRTEELRTTALSQVETIDKLRNDMTDSLEGLDDLISSQSDRLATLQKQHENLNQETQQLRTSWAEDEDKTQDKIFMQLTQIDALNERTDRLVDKFAQALEQFETISDPARMSAPEIEKASVKPLPLRGSLDSTASINPDSFISPASQPLDIPPLKAISNETIGDIQDPLSLVHEDIDPQDLQPPLDLELPPALQNQQQRLSDQRIFDAQQPSRQNWFKRFGRRATDPVTTVASAPPALTQPHGETAAPIQTQSFDQTHLETGLSLNERLVLEQLSPDALIDSGCIRRAAQLRLHEGPFAMSRYVAAHLGAAVDHLRQVMPHNRALRTQVHEAAASFPLRERLDVRDEDALNFILSSESGREYLLCDAALNG